MGRGLVALVVVLGAASVGAAKPIEIDGTLDGKPVSGTVERVRQADGTYVVQARLSNGMTGQGTKLGSGLWKITVSPPSSQPEGKAVGLRGKLAGEDGQPTEEAPIVAKPLTLLLVKRGKSVRATLQRDGKSVGNLTRARKKKASGQQRSQDLVRFADFDQRLGEQPKVPQAPKKTFDRDADVALMEKVLQDTIRQMNARGERFDHPIPFLSGLWGNTLYKYQRSGRFLDAPFGALFDRLYNQNGRYRNVKECYDQAETVLAALKPKLPQLSSAEWELGIASQPGHYWAVARIDLSKVPGAGQGYMFVHMDPWKDSFDVEYGDASSVEWSARP